MIYLASVVEDFNPGIKNLRRNDRNGGGFEQKKIQQTKNSTDVQTSHEIFLQLLTFEGKKKNSRTVFLPFVE